MDPYKLRERLKKDVPTVGIFPILTNPDYSEEEYQEILKDQLQIKHDLDTGKVRKVPVFTYEEKQLGRDKLYEKGWYKPKTVELPESILRNDN